jgi:hypothetical protein
LVVVVDSILLSFYLFHSLPHTSNQPPLFCVCTSAFIVQCSNPIQPSEKHCVVVNGIWLFLQLLEHMDDMDAALQDPTC